MNNGAPSTNSRPEQAITGVMPPSLGEARIRETFPSVLGLSKSLAGLGKMLIKSVFLAPLGWLVLAPLFVRRITPFIAKRYTLTNRRVMIQRGLKPSMSQQVELKDIDDVRPVEGTYDPFFRAGDLEIISKGAVALKLVGVPEAEGFRRAILSAVAAWVPGKGSLQGKFLAASASK
jgi:hypothetical protein